MAEFSNDLWWSYEVNVGGGGGNNSPVVPDGLWFKTLACDEKARTKPETKVRNYIKNQESK